jgi:Fur family peroxide stress response transcriptional regulator
MKRGAKLKVDEDLDERLARAGFRLTPQRRHVYQVLLQQGTHPTAEEVFMRAKSGMPEISLATVYNCLEALVASKLVRLVNLERAATRYCHNMHDHAHFYCDACGCVYDVEWPAEAPAPAWPVPRGFQPDQVDVSIRGRCAKCAASPTKTSN